MERTDQGERGGGSLEKLKIGLWKRVGFSWCYFKNDNMSTYLLDLTPLSNSASTIRYGLCNSLLEWTESDGMINCQLRCRNQSSPV